MTPYTLHMRLFDEHTQETLVCLDVPTLRERDHGLRYVVANDCKATYYNPLESPQEVICSAEWMVPEEIAEMTGVERLPEDTITHYRLAPGDDITFSMRVGQIAFTLAQGTVRER